MNISPNSNVHENTPKLPTVRNQLIVLAALLILLLLSAGSALLPLGVFNTVANLGIATIKVLLVMVFFMRLRSSSPLIRIASTVGFAWLSMLIVLAVADLLTRVPLHVPW